jgi:oligosaccharyltransferase complex subunit alpha (ribophorin I)
MVVTAIVFKFRFLKSCRLDFQARPHLRGASAFRNLVAKLPPRAHSIYYRDEIGNISTSNVWGDPKKVDILIDSKKI